MHPDSSARSNARAAGQSIIATADWSISEIYRRPLEFPARSESGAASKRHAAFRDILHSYLSSLPSLSCSGEKLTLR